MAIACPFSPTSVLLLPPNRVLWARVNAASTTMDTAVPIMNDLVRSLALSSRRAISRTVPSGGTGSPAADTRAPSSPAPGDPVSRLGTRVAPDPALPARETPQERRPPGRAERQHRPAGVLGVPRGHEVRAE